jgi:hypothetical protein
VHAPDAGEDDVACAERVGLSVQLGLDLAREKEVRLLERMVVRLCGSADLVVHREQRQQVRPESAVDEHLDADSAVREQRRVHPRWAATPRRVVHAQRLELRRRALVMADEPQARVAERRSLGGPCERLHVERFAREERVPATRIGLLPNRGVHRQQPDLDVTGVRQGMPGPHVHQGVVAGDEAVDPPVDLDEQLAREDVQRLLKRMDVARQPAAGLQRHRGELGMDGARRRPNHDVAREAVGRRRRSHRRGAERPVEPADVMHAPPRRRVRRVCSGA